MSAPAVIDSLEFARTGQRLSGSLPVSSFPRLEDMVAGKAGDITYEVKGTRDARNRPMLVLHVGGTLALQCQRCLGVLEYPLDVTSSVLVVPQGTTPDDADDPRRPGLHRGTARTRSRGIDRRRDIVVRAIRSAPRRPVRRQPFRG